LTKCRLVAQWPFQRGEGLTQAQQALQFGDLFDEVIGVKSARLVKARAQCSRSALRPSNRLLTSSVSCSPACCMTALKFCLSMRTG